MADAPPKADLRARMKAARADMRAAPGGLIEHWPGADPDVIIGGFWPMGSEIDIRPLLRHLALSHRLVLPVTPKPGKPLTFRAWTPGDSLIEGRFGTREPDLQAERFTPNVILLPLLAWDRRGGRLGYGGGYYDRTLAAISARAIGVGFDEQEVAQVPMADHDMRLDAILTPSCSIEFRA